MLNLYYFKRKVVSILGLIITIHLSAQSVSVGNGSYTTVFPGTDAAGRNSYPSGSPKLSGNAAGKPVPTNDWWSSLLKQDHVNNLFNYPLALRTVNQGLVVSYIVPTSTANGSTEPMDDTLPITVGVSGLNSAGNTVSDYSDWTVTINWTNDAHTFEATTGLGMPFIYFTKNTSDIAEIKVNQGVVTVDKEMLIIKDSRQGSDYAVYAPSGSIWTKNGNVYTSTLNGKNYWSMAFLPPAATDLAAVAQEYKQYAYVFPSDTKAEWHFDEKTSKVSTTFTVTPDVKEGSATNFLQGLLPHQWAHLAASSPNPQGHIYSSIRGDIKTLGGNSFTVENSFYGVLPTLPYLDTNSSGFDVSKLQDKISQIENDQLDTWTDSYNEGQVMNRLIQTARIADESGNTAARDKIIQTIKNRLENWLKADAGEVAFLFYYNTTWNALLGYPAGHGQDSNLNDHHFHWGYFIHAAAFLEQYQPGWAAQWGGMINLLVRDAASWDRKDSMFPYLRNFSPYAGHSWANGFATFPFGNDQESTSESMQFASSLIHWGTVTNTKEIRDLGIYLYTTEQSAIEEYWFDINKRTFKPGYGYTLASRIWGNGYDNQTFWTSDIAAAYGIELYPIHGGSLYLGQHPEYIQKLWNEMTSKTGILANQANDNLWYDVYWEYLVFIDPQKAINLYNSYRQRNLKFGISDAQTYHWLHAMNALGQVNTAVTADYPLATSFVKNGVTTYVAQNYSDQPILVTFSDMYQLSVPARKMVTSKDIDVSGILVSSFQQAYPGGSVDLNVQVKGHGITKVEFYDGDQKIGEDNTAPYTFTAGKLQLGIHKIYAKVFVNLIAVSTNVVSVQVGEQKPYLGTPFQIPGVIQSGNYDKFEGGLAQNISYFDTTPENQGDYRKNEYVDASQDNSEGPIVGWIAAGEWLDYTIDVKTSGVYTGNVRYACGNSSNGGPFRIEVDGKIVSSDIDMPYSGGWDHWTDKTIENIPLVQGKHILRVYASGGEFNFGKMTFTFTGELGYVPPIANAGDNVIVVLPSSIASLDGSKSTYQQGAAISYQWEQIFGPSVIHFDAQNTISPKISNLQEGVYKCRLILNDGAHSSASDVLVIVSATGNYPPNIEITSPSDGSSYLKGQTIALQVSASDLDGTIGNVKYYAGETSIGESNEAPFALQWVPAASGTYSITAVATDNGGVQASSEPVTVLVSDVASCSETSNNAQQGNFSTGYKATFETIGTNVVITFELLDTDRIGVVAYLWKPSPFTEVMMDHVSGQVFSKTIANQTVGTTISYAAKFAFAGGLAVTQYIDYTVGANCSLSTGEIKEPKEVSVLLYPNPASHEITVKVNDSKIDKIEIYSLSGSRVLQSSATTINVSQLPASLYLVKIFTENTIITRKLIIK